MLAEAKEVKMFGTTGWCGTYKGMPALITSYYGGADLWVYGEDGWEKLYTSSAGAFTLYEDLKQHLVPQYVKVGPTAVGWLDTETNVRR